MAVSPQADFREVIRTLDAIDLPAVRVSGEHVRFAILELLNNSIRAHREKSEGRDISLDMTLSDGRLVVAIRDFGGGFDPKRLPYDVDADPGSLDLHSPPFEEYQKRNGYKRFGMGIFVAKKTFEDFRLMFLDAEEKPAPWAPGRITGTLIILSVRVLAEGEVAGTFQGEAIHGR